MTLASTPSRTIPTTLTNSVLPRLGWFPSIRKIALSTVTKWLASSPVSSMATALATSASPRKQTPQQGAQVLRQPLDRGHLEVELMGRRRLDVRPVHEDPGARVPPRTAQNEVRVEDGPPGVVGDALEPGRQQVAAE